MFHPSTQRLIDDWIRRRGDLKAPRRADFSPAGLSALMPQLFMLGEDGNVRLAGGLVIDLFRRELRGTAFSALWRMPDATKAALALIEAEAGLQPVVLTATAHTAEGHETRLEIGLAPLAGRNGRIERFLGLVQPLSTLARLGGKAVEALSFQDFALADGSDPLWFDGAEPSRRASSALKLVALDGRRVA